MDFSVRSSRVLHMFSPRNTFLFHYVSITFTCFSLESWQVTLDSRLFIHISGWLYSGQGVIRWKQSKTKPTSWSRICTFSHPAHLCSIWQDAGGRLLEEMLRAKLAHSYRMALLTVYISIHFVPELFFYAYSWDVDWKWLGKNYCLHSPPPISFHLLSNISFLCYMLFK